MYAGMNSDVCAWDLRINYVAQIDIPAREYEYIEDGQDEEGNTKYRQEAKPFDMEKVVITLWEVKE